MKDAKWKMLNRIWDLQDQIHVLEDKAAALAEQTPSMSFDGTLGRSGLYSDPTASTAIKLERVHAKIAELDAEREELQRQVDEIEAAELEELLASSPQAREMYRLIQEGVSIPEAARIAYGSDS